MDYGQRSGAVTATIGNNGADDGEAGEGDEILGSGVTEVKTGAGDDVVAAFVRRVTSPCSTCTTVPKPVAFETGGGVDQLRGGNADDRLDGGSGIDRIFGFGGDDTIAARDGVADQIDCGQGDDVANRDKVDTIVACERGTTAVGRLRLTPAALSVKAGERARVRLSWTHPVNWRQLRRIVLRVYRDDVRVGAITVRPRGGRITAAGALKLARRDSRIVHKGKAVNARLALGLPHSLAGRRLRVEVEAVDVRGRRQVERRAGSIRVLS